MIVGKYTYGHTNINHIFKDEFPNVKLIIGSFCSIANNIKVYYGHGYHDSNAISTYPFGYVDFGTEKFNKGKTNGDIIIGNDVWIGDNVTIMSGVNIGDGSVIANNSHIAKDVDPYSIVGGNPCEIIKYRFDKEIIDKLLNIKWWDMEDSEISKFQKKLNGYDIEEFISLFEQK